MPALNAESAYIFRITHVRNVPWILRHGVHCQSSTVQDPNFVVIGNAELIQKRSARVVTVAPGGMFSDYVPFYFTPWSIMLFNIHTGYNGVPKVANCDIAILVSSLRNLPGSGTLAVFTDGHAYTQGTEFFSDLDDLGKIDWPLLRAKDFRNDPEDPSKKSRYQAEAMVHRHLPVEAMLGIVCHDAGVQSQLSGCAQQAGVRVPIRALPQWYFA